MIKSYEDKDQDYNKDKDKDMPPKFVFFGKEYLLLIIGYLVQINLAFLDAYEIKDGKINLNVPLFILKILMIIETLKRIYFYICAIKLLFVMECNEREDCIYEMTFEIVYAYLWYNFYRCYNSSGYHLNLCFYIVGIFFSLIHGFLALGCYFLVIKICFAVLNICYISAHAYSIYWLRRESY
jgi:hypothetical protein